MHSSEKHMFAFFWHHDKTLPSTNVGAIIHCTDEPLLHRITHVLRLAKYDQCIFFDRSFHCTVQLHEITKKYFTAEIIACSPNSTLEPPLVFLLPLLRREALHEAVYGLTEVGCTTIQLITTAKIQASWQGQKELEKLEKIMIAAAEQAKFYSFGSINPPMSLEEALSMHESGANKFFLDATGQPLLKKASLKCLDTKKIGPSVILAGPEGDLTKEEKKLVFQANFMPVCLTPTILRAPQAAILAAGIFRSLGVSIG